MSSDRDRFHPEGHLTLWAGVLLAPLAWFLHQQVSYLLVYAACESGSLVGFSVWSVIMLLLVGGSGFVAWRAWDHAGRGWGETGDRDLDRTRFLALLGLMGCGLFSVLIAAQWIPTLLVGPCTR
jgi:hypothetical protein